MGIFINEIGYQTNSQKRATVLDNGIFNLIDKTTDKIIFSAEAKHKGLDESSGDDCYIFDFTKVNKKGMYFIESADKKETSATFIVSDDVYADIMTDLVKCLHYQRCGCELLEEHVGEYKHSICHNKPSIMVEDYINKVENPRQFDMTGGWHDAGDYGKYISPAAVTIGHLLYAYELFEDEISMDLNIPESGNGVPDVLNEIRYELEWMFKMQTENGGVYHKVTTFSHIPFMMPQEDEDQMLIYPVSSMATADFTACMALVSRVYRKYDSELSDRALNAARKAFNWLTLNEYIGFANPKGSNTGQYEDSTDADERMWAAAEMLRSDSKGDTNLYKSMLQKYVKSDIPKTDFGWTDVSGFAALSVLTDENHLAGSEIENILRIELFKEADRLLELMKTTGYELAMKTDDFVWGSNMVVTNRGILFVFAGWLLNRNVSAKSYAEHNQHEYLEAAGAHLNYILGRNALGRSYVTGYGEHAFKNPHNRTSACDGVDKVMPGWVSGGPFKDFLDVDALELIPKGTAAQKCHADVVGSYSTNEITIYWNSSMILMLAGIMDAK